MKIIPKNWTNFQHYKHRSPPWIKLHKNLLDDMQYQRLPIASKALAPMLWLLASDTNDGVINKTAEEIAFRLRMTEKEVLTAIKPLIDNGFFIDADSVLAECVQDATTEKRQSRDRVERIASNKIIFDADNRQFLNIQQSDLDIWKKAYPAVDLQLEMNKAVVWLIANPTKVKSNYQKFLTGWFNRCQDKGGSRLTTKSNQFAGAI